jgi:hypothetical protein
MNKILGVFYFKKTQSGNLIGEFSNNGMDTFNIESSNIKDNFDIKKFDAEYITTWIEDIETHIAELKIIRTEKNYNLKWYKINSENIIFEGTAIEVDNLLIGKYNNK